MYLAALVFEYVAYLVVKYLKRFECMLDLTNNIGELVQSISVNFSGNVLYRQPPIDYAMFFNYRYLIIGDIVLPMRAKSSFK